MSHLPQPFPPDWASAWGDDVYGLWAELVVRDVRQRLRWIAPGEFWMGSPKEGSAAADEWPRHRVRIRFGFWMADTACTQALWQAVMGNNPSHFTGNLQHPVETVSWGDVQVFLQALGSPAFLTPDLPTEAEWEYACRAGTEGAFHFGARITPKLVNYGNLQKRTVPVKAFPANSWGLFQMHGNVWEWCKDGQRKYTAAAVAVEDPEGPMGKTLVRALRGGSWFYQAGLARSAYRDSLRPDGWVQDVGFRLVLRSTRPAR